MNYRFGSDLRIRKHRLISNWRPSTLWATILGSVFFTIAAVSLASHKPLEFLYFQF
jgi:hypothetical protein